MMEVWWFIIEVTNMSLMLRKYLLCTYKKSLNVINHLTKQISPIDFIYFY